MHRQLDPGHHLEAVAALDDGEDVLGDEARPREALGVPAVGPGELEEDNVSHQMAQCVMLFQISRLRGLELAVFKWTLAGGFGVLGLVAFELILNYTLEV